MHINYHYLLSKMTASFSPRSPVVLDYGCGGGEIIEAGRKAGLEIYGVDVFYEGAESRSKIEQTGWLGTVVREVEDGIIPFDDRFFDLVISNQVLEHVEDLDSVLQEVRRVLKPGGTFLSLFPTKEIIPEKHCGIPCLHWFPKQSRPRFYYAVGLRKMGFGYFKGNKSASQWASDFLEWLDAFTWYRDRKTIYASFGRHFAISSIEDDYIDYRLNSRGWTLLSSIFRVSFVQPLGCELFRRLGGLVILASKAGEKSSPDSGSGSSSVK